MPMCLFFPNADVLTIDLPRENTDIGGYEIVIDLPTSGARLMTPAKCHFTCTHRVCLILQRKKV